MHEALTPREGPVLETARLVLRAMSPSDLAFVAEMLADAEVMRFFPKPFTIMESKAWIRRQELRYATDGHGYWLAALRRTDLPVGQAGVMTIDVEGCREHALGYIVHRPYWRRGFATEAAAASRDYVFDVLGSPRVVTLIRPENEPSLAVARRIGLRPERVVRYAGYDHLLLAGRREDRPAAP
jgi:RimJ/RimL family protein N-acetyltransferase